MTYLVVFQSAMDTEAKQIAIEMQKASYIQSGQGQAKDVWGGATNTATQSNGEMLLYLKMLLIALINNYVLRYSSSCKGLLTLERGNLWMYL